ncbi:NAD(P)-binding protein [Daedalea quercina L-15889]|uniref:NAD(P)-binding protein n=1 Tax=Daedalea quercina L-15889 TaxID=1314783 RepID=A0A165NX22_9APHY|nr:NAD(P)-binding protein [Daedalea quercina L-15889]
MTPTHQKKLILVVGATGAQGLLVIDKLLAPSKDGAPSPYAIRALTRNPDGRRAKELAAKGVEIVQGSHDDFASVAAALKGVYGAWINTDGFTVGEEKEVWEGIRIFELAKQARVRHYIWSNLDYSSKLANYNPTYKCGHYDGKGRVADFMQAQPSIVSDTEMSWTVVTSGPYMEMLYNFMFGPYKKRADGTVVFATPVGKGHVQMIALEDLGFFARYAFDHRELTSAQDLIIASDRVGWEYLKATFEKVTGQRAEIVYQSYDDWCKNLKNIDKPVANERGPVDDGSMTWRENFRAFWSMWRDDLIPRDYEWLRRVNPKGYTLESWMRAKHYGENDLWSGVNLLKNTEDQRMGTMPDLEYIENNL